MIKIAVAGAAGKMGRMILGLAGQDPEFSVRGGLEHPDCPMLGHDLGEWTGKGSTGVNLTADASEALGDAEVLIDFSHHSATRANLEAAQRAKCGVVIGTTNLSPELLKRIRKASEKIAIVQSPNMSVGVNLLFSLTEIAARVLNEGYDAELMEIHHRMKKDAPSGTAAKLLDILSRARGKKTGENAVYGREGETGVRPQNQIGVFALRGGDVAGEHTLYFLGEGERLELTHRASSRDCFAQGALRAAKFLAKKKSGLYDMGQVLGIS